MVSTAPCRCSRVGVKSIGTWGRGGLGAEQEPMAAGQPGGSGGGCAQQGRGVRSWVAGGAEWGGVIRETRAACQRRAPYRWQDIMVRKAGGMGGVGWDGQEGWAGVGGEGWE
jgi:hypothetical protein